MKKLCFLIFIVLLGQNILGQETVISGKVLAGDSRRPVPDVQIIDNESGTGTTTGSDGRFFLKIKSDKNIVLTFSHISYHPLKITYKPGKNYKGQTLFLEPKTEVLQELEIMGVPVKERSYRTEHVGIKKIERSNLNDIGNLLRTVPNVSGIRKGAVGIDPVVRGFKFSQLNVQLNGGTRIEGGCPNRMDPATAHVDMNDLKNITILKGPFALKYGVNFAGVIDLTTYNPEFYDKYKTHVRTFLGGQTNQEGFKTKVAVQGANKIFTYQFSGSWKKFGDYEDGNGKLVPSSFEHQQYSGNIGFRIAQNHTIYATAKYSPGTNVDFPALPMDERKDDTKIYSLNYLSGTLGKSVNFIRFKAYFSDVHHTMDNKNRPFSDTVVAISTIHATSAGGKFGINLNVGKGQMEVGADYENTRKDGTREKYLIMQPLLPNKEEDLWNNALIGNTGVFAEYHRKSEKIDWVAAMRLDYNSATSNPLIRKNMADKPVYQNDSTESHYLNFSISGGITWHINKQNELFFSLGRGTRSPDMTERFIILLPIGYDPYDYLGNPQLKPETNNEVDLGYRFNNRKAGSIELSGFFSYVTDYITGELVPPSEIKPQTAGVLGVKKFENVPEVFMSGFELTYQTPARYLWHVNFNAAYTMGWNPEATVYIVENGQVVDKTTVKNDPLPEIPPFEINIGFNYKFFRQKFVPSVSLRMAAAQNRISQAYNEKTTPGFAIVNLDLRYNFNSILTVYAGIKNLFNTAYYEHLNRNIIGTSYPLYEPGRIFYANLIFHL